MYPVDQLFLSFNGGKDCTVLLNVVSQALNMRGLDNDRILYIYIRPEDSFEEVEEFVKNCEDVFSIKMTIYEGNLKNALRKVLKNNTKLKACFLGQRRTDPYCENLTYFQKTDSNWPELDRINPLLEWNCDNIWEYLLINKIKYCSLYENGYTSLGTKSNTTPNPHLQRVDSKGNIYYLPAHCLREDFLERAGRLK